jgi:glycosyl transferase family 87
MKATKPFSVDRLRLRTLLRTIAPTRRHVFVLAAGMLLFVGTGIKALRTSIADAHSFDMMDLHERAIGTRQLSRGLTPYLVHSQDPYLSDPCAFGPVGFASRATNPPATYLFIAPFARLSYKTIKIVWLWVQWVSLLAAIIAFIAWDVTQLGAILAVVALSLFMTAPLRLHLERGQMYTVVLALLAVGSTLHVRYKWPLAGGALYGVAMAVKVIPGVLFLPLLVARQWRALIGAMLGGAMTVGLSVALWGTGPWRDFIVRFVLGVAVAPAMETSPACSMLSMSQVVNATWLYCLSALGIAANQVWVNRAVWLALAIAVVAMELHRRAHRELGTWWWLWMSLFLHIVWPAAPVYWRYQEVLWLLVLPVGIGLYRSRQLTPLPSAALACVMFAIVQELPDYVASGLMLVFLAILAGKALTVADPLPSDTIRLE